MDTNSRKRKVENDQEESNDSKKVVISIKSSDTDSLSSSDNDDETFGLKRQYLKSLGIKPPLQKWVHVSRFRCDKSDLREVMELAGVVIHCTVMKTATKYARVMFSHPLEAVQAISMFNGKQFFGRPLKLTMLKCPDNAFILPRGLPSIGPGLGIDGKPIRDIVQQYKNYQNKRPSLVNVSLFEDDGDVENIETKEESNGYSSEEGISDFQNAVIAIKDIDLPASVPGESTGQLRDNSSRSSSENEQERAGPSNVPYNNNDRNPNKPDTDQRDLKSDQSATTTEAQGSQSNNPQLNNPQSNNPQSNNLQSSNAQSINPQSNNAQSNHPQSNNLQSNNPQSNNPNSNNPHANNAQSNILQSSNPQSNNPQPNNLQSNNLHSNNPQPNNLQSNNPQANDLQSNNPQPINNVIRTVVDPTIRRPAHVQPVNTGSYTQITAHSGQINPIITNIPKPSYVPQALPNTMHNQPQLQYHAHDPVSYNYVYMTPQYGPSMMMTNMPPVANQRTTLYFSNLPPSTTFHMLSERLSQCGQILSLRLTTPGCAEATFAHSAQAEWCYHFINGRCIDGCVVSVQLV